MNRRAMDFIALRGNINTALQFGGGKDSLACLFLLKPYWHRIYVCWMDTGASFPETIALMSKVERIVPHFVHMKSDVMRDIEQFGWPVDVVPLDATGVTKGLKETESSIQVRAWLHCCGNNIWFPMNDYMHRLEVSHIIRGQRNDENYKSTIRDGHQEDGFTYHFPLQDWTEQQVFDYLKEQRVRIPSYYEYTGTSLDCWNCTAYLDAKQGQLRYMRKHHPEKFEIVMDKLSEIRSTTMRALEPLNEALKIEED